MKVIKLEEGIVVPVRRPFLFFCHLIVQLQQASQAGLPSVTHTQAPNATAAEIPESDSDSDESSKGSGDEDMQNRAKLIAQLEAADLCQPFLGDV